MDFLRQKYLAKTVVFLYILPATISAAGIGSSFVGALCPVFPKEG
jgi:hypothetical protein